MTIDIPVRRGSAGQATLLVFPLLALALSLPAAGSSYLEIPLVSDLDGLAPVTDPNLVNPWGIAFSPTGPFWIADNRTGVSTIYTGGQPESLVVVIPPPSGGQVPSAPTGVVFNETAGFEVSPGQPARFLFATEDGTISGWNPAVNPTGAILMVDNSSSGAIYMGLALATRAGAPTLYATNFHANTIDAFDQFYAQIVLPGNFNDPNLPAGYAPFGISVSGTSILVTYGLRDAQGEGVDSGPGHGFVNVFDTEGVFLRRLVSQGALNSPWGLALAPADFGQFSGNLLVGNFGDGRINAFDAGTGVFEGTLADSSDSDIAIEGLWGLTFGNGGNGGDPQTLYFTAGISGGGQVEDHGLFGAIELASDEPTPVLLVSFTATTEADGVLLQWNLISDAGPASFHVYRSTDATEWQRLDSDPVHAPAGRGYRFLDGTAEAGAVYTYRIAALEADGSERTFGSLRFKVGVPVGLALHADPSPTAGPATIVFSLPKGGATRLALFDVSGRLVASVADARYPAGVHRLAWNGTDVAGRHLSAGAYFLKLEAAGESATVPLIVIR